MDRERAYRRREMTGRGRPVTRDGEAGGLSSAAQDARSSVARRPSDRGPDPAPAHAARRAG
ncbi:hypothetical protein STHAL_03750 [Streptomyces halstedii]|uniref:Uncharacterized protein n=1 Tax=Streptomyces halstedii TaxID=1944 RepID=A0ABS6TK71_STRHA|nr:hypothetical protein [Streptomyces halstedii]MBV7668617.1 hypothetical protein [Streptomyces halstedii]